MTSLPATISRELRDPLNLIRWLPTLVAIGLVLYAIIAGGYFVALAGFALIYAVFVTGLNIFMGLGGQASFGHNAFAAISGYTSAVLTTSYGWEMLPAMADSEASFAELKQRCANTIAYLASIDADAFNAGATREIELKFPNGGGMRFDGITYLTGFVIPNFYFHTSMVYAILRAQGVEIGKFDYLAHMAPHAFAPPAG